jgi:molybdopterin biosynthesis enzyme
VKKIRVEDAVGTVLAHDITRIVAGKTKGVGFKKGHIVCAEDIPELLKIGKKHLFILELGSDQLHEDDAALRIARAAAGRRLEWTRPREGKTNLIARNDGLLKIDVDALLEINRMDDIILSTLKSGTPVKKGQTVAATRIIPLTILSSKIEALEKTCRQAGSIVDVRPFRQLAVGGLVTGSEIYEGRIDDGFDDFVTPKLQQYGCRLIDKIIAPDDPDAIAAALGKLRQTGCELILSTGGLSVDPDDVTRMGVRRAGARIINYGSPVLPGAMVLYAMLDGIPILGLPACVFYHPTTIFDLMLPRILAGETITRDTFAAMGHGGLCMDCKICRFPDCPFGR